MTNSLALKQGIYEVVCHLLTEKIQTAETAMQAAQASANEETKSSAGDKYETGRAMAQNDRDMYARQFLQLKQEMQTVDWAFKTTVSEIVSAGSLVHTSLGWIWIAVSIGHVKWETTSVMVVSAASPIGQSIWHKKVGETFVFRNQTHQIIELA
jgi:hypothetical protein